MKTGILIILAVGLLGLLAYKRSEISSADSRSRNEIAAHSGSAEDNERNSTKADAQDSASNAAGTYSYSEPPQANANISVDDAYTAIPHRRTVWSEDQTTVPAGERAYLKTMFQVLDQTVVARVAGIQNYSRGDFASFDAEGQLGQLKDYVRQAQVPPALVDYNSPILAALAGEQQFFRDWKSDPEHFDYMRQVNNHPGVSQSSAALRAAYQDLMSKYPQENKSNQDAFFDYHCAADFR